MKEVAEQTPPKDTPRVLLQDELIKFLSEKPDVETIIRGRFTIYRSKESGRPTAGQLQEDEEMFVVLNSLALFYYRKHTVPKNEPIPQVVISCIIKSEELVWAINFDDLSFGGRRKLLVGFLNGDHPSICEAGWFGFKGFDYFAMRDDENFNPHHELYQRPTTDKILVLGMDSVEKLQLIIKVDDICSIRGYTGDNLREEITMPSTFAVSMICNLLDDGYKRLVVQDDGEALLDNGVPFWEKWFEKLEVSYRYIGP